MRKKLMVALAVGVFAGLFSGFVFAQNNGQAITSTKDLYVISAKAGGVNFIEGEVFVAGKNRKGGTLLKGDTVEIGDKVSTGTSGKAEILLNPGSYIRLAENSSFEFVTTSLDNLQIKLNSGSAIFEVIADDKFMIAVKTPKANFSIITSGVYRVNVLSDGSGKIAVWRGTARIGNYFEETDVKAGKEAVANGRKFSIAKFDRDEQDALDTWSKTRAKDLAKVNSRLQKPNLRNSLISGFGASRWNMYNSFGLWVFDQSFGSFCFLPFGYGWSSPYGYSYGRDLWDFRLPPIIYNQPPPSGDGTTVAGKSRIRAIMNEPMPYERIQTKIERNAFDRYVDNSQIPNNMPSTGASSTGATPPTTVAAPAKSVRLIDN